MASFLSSLKSQTGSVFGKALIQESIERTKRDNTDRAVNVVQSVLAAYDGAVNQIAHLEKWRDIYEQQIEAIGEGDFTFDVNGRIIYDDSNLNRTSV